MVVLRTALAMLTMIVAMSWQQMSAGAQPSCRFTLGFASLRDLVGADKVGDCLEDERFNVASGDAEQRTTGGLLIWRHAHNVTVFIDGTTIWANGPNGLQSRPIGERFDWENDASNASQPALPTGGSTSTSSPPPIGSSVFVLPSPQATPPPSSSTVGSVPSPGPTRGEPLASSSTSSSPATRGIPSDAGTSPTPTASATPSSTSPSSKAEAAGRTDPVRGACPPSHMIKGATTSKGQRLFYEPDRPEYSKATPEVCFTAGGDARDAGYISSKR